MTSHVYPASGRNGRSNKGYPKAASASDAILGRIRNLSSNDVAVFDRDFVFFFRDGLVPSRLEYQVCGVPGLKNLTLLLE